MKEEIYSFCKDVLQVSDENLIDEFYRFSELRPYKRGEHIVQIGDEQKDIPFLVKGVARGYYLEGEKEITDCIATAAGRPLIGFTILNPENLVETAEVGVVAMTDCEVIKISISAILPMMTKYREGAMVYIRLLEYSLEEHIAGKHMLSIRKPEDRYKWFCNQFPELVELLRDKKIKQKDIASYLNMTEQTFSKISKFPRESENK